MLNAITKIFGSKHERDIKKINPFVDEINSLYCEYHFFSDDQLRFKTREFKAKIQTAVGNIQSEIEELNIALRSDIAEKDEEHDVEDIRDRIKELEAE